MIRIVLAEDQKLLLGAIGALLELDPNLKVVGSAATGAEARELIVTLAPDIVISDIEMPGMTGLDLAEWLAGARPHTRMLILTTFARPGYLRRALDAGVAGYLLKETPAEQLAEAVHRVHSGERVIAPELALTAFGPPNPLTARERQVVALAGKGVGNAEISKRLHLAEGTVRNYLSEAMGKLNASNRVEAFRIARDQGWL